VKILSTMVLFAVGLAFAGAVVGADSSPVRIRGDIVSYAAGTLTVHRRSGDTVSIAFNAGISISAVRKMTLTDIKPGSFIGTAARTDVDGHLIAQEVVVFPESARGTGEGHYAWDLGPQSSMTNANVDAVVQSTSGNDLHLSYKGGTNTVTVPANVPIVTFIPAAPIDLLAGKKVFVVATVDSGDRYTGLRIVVEKDGIVPPM
jgi:hypothetical protein